MREAEGKARQTLDEVRSRARREADAILTRTRIEAEALRRSVLSSKIRANRLKILEEKNRIVRSVMSSVEEKLAVIARTSMFQDALKKMVSEAVDAVGAEQQIVRVGFRDLSKKDLDSVSKSLPRRAKLIVEDGAIDELGGVVASDSQGRMIYNNSFRARIDRLDTQLLVLISSTIFGE